MISRSWIRSDQISRSVVSNSLRPHESQHARPPCPSPTPGGHSDSRPSNHWCHPAISSSVVPFSSCPQSLPASESFPESTLRMRWPKYWSFSFSIIPSKVSTKLIYNTKTPTTDVCRKIYRINCKGYIVIDIGYSNSVVWAAAESWITDLQAGKKVTIHLLIGSFNIHGYYCLRARWGLEGRSFCIWLNYKVGFPGGASGKESACQCRRH